MKIFSSLLCSLVFVQLLSCSKKSDPDPVQPSKTDHISASAWKYENAGIDNDRNGTIDLPISTLAPGAIQTCRIDNVLTFRADKSGTADEGAAKCNVGDPQTTPFNWSFVDNETNLTISNNVFALLNGKSKIVTLNETNLTLSRDTVIAATNLSLVVTLKH